MKLKFENVVKGWLTTIIGLGIMSASVYMFFMQSLEWEKALGALVVGFILCWMRTKADTFISKYVNNAIDKKK